MKMKELVEERVFFYLNQPLVPFSTLKIISFLFPSAFEIMISIFMPFQVSLRVSASAYKAM